MEELAEELAGTGLVYLRGLQRALQVRQEKKPHGAMRWPRCRTMKRCFDVSEERLGDG